MDMDMNLDMEMSMDTNMAMDIRHGYNINARNGHRYGLYESQSLIAIFPRNKLLIVKRVNFPKS
jgi:hypothetical protein